MVGRQVRSVRWRTRFHDQSLSHLRFGDVRRAERIGNGRDVAFVAMTLAMVYLSKKTVFCGSN